jgi:hypothetical protein
MTEPHVPPADTPLSKLPDFDPRGAGDWHRRHLPAVRARPLAA